MKRKLKLLTVSLTSSPLVKTSGSVEKQGQKPLSLFFSKRDTILTFPFLLNCGSCSNVHLGAVLAMSGIELRFSSTDPVKNCYIKNFNKKKCQSSI